MNVVSQPFSATNDRAAEGARAATMNAVYRRAYGDHRVLRVGPIARPAPAADEVLVRVHAAGIDRGACHLLSGRPYLMRLAGFGFRAPKEPVLGLDLAGTVVSVGAAVTRFRVGDEVFGLGRGAFAELACASERKLAHKPAGVSFVDAAVTGVSGMTALQALRDAAKVQAGERVLVLGASGGVGTFAVQLARALGAEVTGVCSAAKVDLVRGLGAQLVLAYEREDFADGARRYDAVLDIGGATPLRRLRRALEPTGRLVFVGAEHQSDWTGGFGRQLAAMLLQPFVKQRFELFLNRETHEDLERLAPMLEAGTLRPAIDRVCSLDEVPQALAELDAGRVRGKIAVAIDAG